MAHFSDLDAGIAGPPIADAGARRRLGRRLSRFFKRGLDILLVLLVAPFVLPVVLVLGLMIRRDGGAAFYCQPRSAAAAGVPPLEAALDGGGRRRQARGLSRGRPPARAEWDQHQKLKDDPRITPAGRLIRKTSLDELPQLWNVLMRRHEPGRPAADDAGADRALPRARPTIALRPGLTGFWQISDRNQTSFASRAAFDTQYSRRLSLLHRHMVLLATVWVVMRGTGY